METASTFNDDLYVMRENLRSLRTAFLVLFVGSILMIIPIIDIAGAVLLFIGIIMLIIGLGRIGNSKMVNARQYISTRNWLVFNIIASIAVSVTVYYFLYTLLISPILSSAIASETPPTIPASVFREIFLITGASVAVIIVIYVIAYLKLAGTLKLLSAELSVPKLGSASTYLKVSMVLSAITSVIAVVSYYFTLHTIIISAPANGSVGLTGSPVFDLLGALIYTFIAAIVAFIFELLAFHGAYSGIDEFFAVADYKLQNRNVK